MAFSRNKISRALIPIGGVVLFLAFQNCSGINLMDGDSSSSLACVEPLKISSVRESTSVRFLVVSNPGENPVSGNYNWKVTFGSTTMTTGTGNQITVPNDSLTACSRYKIEIDQAMQCASSSDMVSTTYIHGENCDPVIEPIDEPTEPEEPADPGGKPADPTEPITYGPDSCPVQPIPQDLGCGYKDALGNDEVPFDNHDGMTTANNRQVNAQFVYGAYGRGYRRPVTSFHTVFNSREEWTAVCGSNCGTVNQGFGFPSKFPTNTHVRQQLGKFIAMKLKVPTGNRWHGMTGRIAPYSNVQTVGFTVAFARCPGQFRSATRNSLPAHCMKSIGEGNGEFRWEIVPPGGSATHPFHCPLEAGQTYYMNLIHADPMTHNLAQTPGCSMDFFDPPLYPGTCGSVMNVGDFIHYDGSGNAVLGCDGRNAP